MAFDINTAVPVENGNSKFDISTASNERTNGNVASLQVTTNMRPETKRESFDLMSPIPNAKQRKELNVAGLTKGVAGRALGNVLALSQREEGIATVLLQNLIDVAAKKDTVLQSAIDVGKESLQVARGETVPELGDIARRFGASEPLAATVGLLGSLGLPSNIITGEGVKSLAKPITKTGKASKLSKGIGNLLGVDGDVLDEIATMGYRQVINKKFKNKKIPSMMVDYIESNAEEVLKRIGDKYDEIVPVLQGISIENVEGLKDDIAKLPVFKKFLTKGTGEPRIKIIMESIENANIKSLDDIWVLRKELDDEIFTAKGLKEPVKSLKQVRDKLTDYLHSNEQFKILDEQYSNITEIMKDIGSKVIGDKGENLLARFSKLTSKEKRKLIKLESNLEGANFIDTIKKFALNQSLDPTLTKTGLSRAGVKEKLALPVYRAGLRASQPVRNLIGGLLKPSGKTGMPTARQNITPTR